MKQNISMILTLLMLVFSHSASSEQDLYASDRQSLLEKLTIVESALNNHDINKIIPLLKEDVIVAFINAEVTRNIPDLVAYYEKVISGSTAILKEYSTKATLAAPARIYGNIAMADGSTLDTYTLATGEVIEMKTIWSTVLVKENNDWKVSQLHFSANPFKNSIIESLKKNLLIIAIIAVIVSLVIGVIVGRTTKKNA